MIFNFRQVYELILSILASTLKVRYFSTFKFIYGKLKKINDSIDELRETLKYFDRTNESLMKVQKLSEGIFGKM